MNKRLILILNIISLFSLLSCVTENYEADSNEDEVVQHITFKTSEKVKQANAYIDDNMYKVSTEYRNTYHMMPPIGWCNDPNGFSEFNGKYHLFYQFNPYSAAWGPMHWGHQTTTDFIKWELQDVALAPDKSYENPSGCFSGTALVKDDILYVTYTAASEFQNQAMAYSSDGITFKKLPALIISDKNLPSNFSNSDFRDPKLFERDGKYYIIAGTIDKINHNRVLALFTSNNLFGPWKYCDYIYSTKNVPGMLECPDLTTIGAYDVLIMSPQSISSSKIYEYQNRDSCVYLIGNLSTVSNKFYKSDSSVKLEEFDKGFSFYAPQTVTTSDGRVVLIAWMGNWVDPITTTNDGWCGAMTLPRELKIIDNHIYQTPVREINNYIFNEKKVDDLELSNETLILNGFESRTSKITLDIDVSTMFGKEKAGIEVYKGSDYSTRIYYDNELGCLVFDRNNCGSILSGVRYCKVEPIDNKIKIEIYLDVNSVEIFINDGYYTMTGTVFAPSGNNNIALFSENGTTNFSNITKAEIFVQ